MKAQAPGKLILSGEHAVVYGAPALSVAVSEQVTITRRPAGSNRFCLTSETEAGTCCSPAELQLLQQRLDRAYQLFLDGQADIADVLQQPTDLLFYLISLYPAEPVTIQLESQLPTGAGMGSSAAVIAALLKLLTADQLDENAFMQQVRFCERLQHGRGSLLDAATVTLGGVVRVQNNKAERLQANLGEGWYHLDTGRPACGTGEVVERVRSKFADSAIWSEFAQLTDQLQRSLGNSDRVVGLVRDNHRLLQAIGVVPTAISALVEKIERLGGAAKISGAGAHLGETAGQLLLYLPDNQLISIQQQLNLKPLPLRQSDKGASLAPDQD